MKKILPYLSAVLGLIILLSVEVIRLTILLPGVFRYRAVNAFVYSATLHHNLYEIAAFVLILTGGILLAANNKKSLRLSVPVLVILLLGTIYFNNKIDITKFFEPLPSTAFDFANNQTDTNSIVMGVMINGISKAYPISIISYHHDVADTVGGVPLLVTYCSLCHSGRIYGTAKTNGIREFKLVGENNGNALFQDSKSHSWWQQSTDIAIEGPLKGTQLTTYTFQQVRLGTWLRMHPGSLILQRNSTFTDRYNYAAKSFFERRSPQSWTDNAWIVTVLADAKQKAFDWNRLLKNKIINSHIGERPIAIFLENDKISFHVWNRSLHDTLLHFEYDKADKKLIDSNTKSVWNADGVCISGKLKGTQLKDVPAYQENWHAFQESAQSYILH